MKLISELMQPKQPPTPKQRQAIEEVCAMASELATLPEVSRRAYLTQIREHTTGRQRWLATRHTMPDHPMFRPLMAMLDALIADRGTVTTKHGAFTREDLHEYRGRIWREDGKELVQFPVSVDKATGMPVYRSLGERKARVESFRAGSHASQDPDWWDEGGDE